MNQCNGQGNIKAAYLHGKIDTSNSKQLRQEVIDCVEADTTTLVLDLHEVTFIDSSGLGSLVFLLKWMRSRGGRVVIYRPNSQVRMLLDIANMTQILPVCSNVEELAAADIQL
ncbi:anti-sigma-factor antagonist [Thalassoporum mexicanum PCC 7367]|uniref:STAS domain-containing protein n=1 Tax=Thalassoporum mexicanum TaxID=3457544 RepID=UPI00029FDFDA|nr:STAS domain-containing protein [Pseudanabaena sp. PCC 7367]AFY68925.1 anti-sigma-factor antagonist [Pseudanabaena sp. PCC 7367]